MPTLYYKPTCPFCDRVIKMAENLKVALHLKDIEDDEAAHTEFQEKGGSGQVPFLVDAEKDVSMHESSDIIEYLREHYANTVTGAKPAPARVHVSGSVCESCEG